MKNHRRRRDRSTSALSELSRRTTKALAPSSQCTSPPPLSSLFFYNSSRPPRLLLLLALLCGCCATTTGSSFLQVNRRRSTTSSEVRAAARQKPPPSSPQRIAISSSMTADNEQATPPLISPVKTEGRKVVTHSLPVFLAAAAIGVPVWAMAILPFTIAYQLVRAALTKLLPTTAEEPYITFDSLDSGYVVDDSDIIPREERKYDLVVLGATGFAGKLAARHLAKTYCFNDGNNKSKSNNEAKVKWAIAGRSQSKLDEIKMELKKEFGGDSNNILLDTIVVDTSVPSTLPNLMRQTRCVASTAGPFALYGNAVVEFCAKFGTHYVDITGEVDWVKSMTHKWQSTARDTGAILVPFCGHDSIPWDMCVYKMRQILKAECDGDALAEATFWDESFGAASGGTIATVLAGIEGDPAKKPPVPPTDPWKNNGNANLVDRVPKFTIGKAVSPWDDNDSKRWEVPFPLAFINGQVVGWSHSMQGGNGDLIYKECAVAEDFKTAFVEQFGLVVFGTMLLNPVTRFLLKRLVLPKPGDGPSADAMENDHYLSILGEGIGRASNNGSKNSENNRVQTIMYFSKDAGYVETSRMLVEAGLCLALEEKNLPVVKGEQKQPPLNGGGFYTPSVAMGDVLMERLLNTGIAKFSYRVVRGSSSD